MSKKISGAEYPLAKIFSSDFEYVIPSYQRPYAWTVDETAELFDDLYDFYQSEQDDTYFLGSIVLIKEEEKPYSEVIDGQQRLTTLTILIASIANKLIGHAQDQFMKYIKEPGNEFESLASKPRLSLRERDRDFFADYVQELKFNELFEKDLETLANESQRNIKLNSKLLHDRIDRFLTSPESIRSFATFLVQRCYLVAVSTPSQKSAFRVFSVMNSRGLDLLPTDIIKADIIGAIEKQFGKNSANSYTEKWEDLEVQTGRNGFNDLFGHIRMIFSKIKAKKALLEEFREQVIHKTNSSTSLIDDILEPYAEAYQIAKTQQYVSTENAQLVNTYLRWLNKIDNSDWLPVAILFLSQYKNDSEYVVRFFKNLERLAAYLHITAKNVNQRIERYAEVLAELQKLQKNHSSQLAIASIDLTKNEKDEMKVTLNGKIYEMTARRRNYLILRLDSFLSDNAAIYDPSVLTIEHVLPQTVELNSQWAKDWPDELKRKEWVHKIANLVPLTQSRNSKAKNFDFKTKKTAYFGGKKNISSYVLTTQVLNTENWTPEVVEARQEILLTEFSKKWELL